MELIFLEMKLVCSPCSLISALKYKKKVNLEFSTSLIRVIRRKRVLYF
jgi:hypothetical protein